MMEMHKIMSKGKFMFLLSGLLSSNHKMITVVQQAGKGAGARVPPPPPETFHREIFSD